MPGGCVISWSTQLRTIAKCLVRHKPSNSCPRRLIATQILTNLYHAHMSLLELVAAALPRLYLKNVEAGVKGMQVMLEQTLGQTGTLPLTVECPNVSMVSHYLNGSRVGDTSVRALCVLVCYFRFLLILTE